MYFSFENAKYCCNCDWLQYSVLLNEAEPEIICPEGLRIELCQGNNIFRDRALIFNSRGEKVLTLLWHPYSKVLNPHIMTVQVANQLLYVPDGKGILWSWQWLQEIVECSFNAIGRFDVCLDFEGSEAVFQFLKHLNSGHYYVQGKREGSTWWHDTNVDGYAHKQLHCLSWGSKQSEIKVKVYHKSREQGVLDGNAENAEKPWIVQEWQLAEMDIRNVWRLEFSFSGAGQLKYNDEVLTLEKMIDANWLLDVLLGCYNTRFVTRINQGRRSGHKNEDQRVNMLSLPLRASHLKWKEAIGQDHEVPASITLLRAMMAQIDNPALIGVPQTFADISATILNLVHVHRLEGYFTRTWEIPADDYFAELSQQVGQGVYYQIASPRKLMS